MKSFAILVALLSFISKPSQSAGLKLAKKALASLITPLALLSSQAAVRADNIVVLGGNGFVGSRVVRELVLHGDKVTSISKSGGRPDTSILSDDLANKATWLKADPSKDKLDLKGADAVVSCIGAIGFDDELVRYVNGDVNIAAVQQAKTQDVKRFVYVSVSSLVPEALGTVLPAYFEGKAAAEASVKSNFGTSGYLIKPSFIYGGDAFTVSPPRVPAGYGSFIDAVLSSPPIRLLASVSPPILKVALVNPVSVDNIARATASASLGLLEKVSYDGSDQINEAAKAL